MDSAAQLLRDREAIADTIRRYAIGIDFRERELYRSCFTDEVDLDYGTFSGKSWVRRASAEEWVSAVMELVTKLDATQHLIVVYRTEIEGDRASCLAYLQAKHLSGNRIFTVGGYYSHKLTRDGERWRINSAKLTPTWTEGDPSVLDVGGQSS